MRLISGKVVNEYILFKYTSGNDRCKIFIDRFGTTYGVNDEEKLNVWKPLVENDGR